jgi:hypothetical protein
VIPSILRLADMGKERIDHDLNEPNLAKLPKRERSPKYEKDVRRFH